MYYYSVLYISNLKFIFIYGISWESSDLLFFIWKAIITESSVRVLQWFLFAPRVTVQFLTLIYFAVENLVPTCFPDIPFHYSPLLCFCRACLLCGPGMYQPLFLPRERPLLLECFPPLALGMFYMATPGYSGLPCPPSRKHTIPSHSPLPNLGQISSTFYFITSYLFSSSHM